MPSSMEFGPLKALWDEVSEGVDEKAERRVSENSWRREFTLPDGFLDVRDVVFSERSVRLGPLYF